MHTNVEIVARNFERFGSGDLPGLIASYADDGVLVHHGPEAAPTRGRYGKAELANYFRTVGETIAIERFQVSSMAGDGDVVVALVDLAFTVRATGKRHEGRAVHVTTLRDGQNLRHEIFPSEPESVYAV